MPAFRTFLTRPVVVILAVTALGGFLRFANLSHPDRLIFDENYYARAACILLGEPDPTCKLDETERLFREQRWDVGSYVHPDLGKWQIAIGEMAFGMTPFGWRATSALAGTLVVLLGSILAWLLFRDAVWTAVAGVFLAVDGMNVALSRTALLDVHLQLWVVAGFLFLVLDRGWIERRVARLDPAHPPPEGVLPAIPSPLWRPWRFAAGAAFGASAAVKWSGVFALLAAAVLAVGWEFARRRRAGRSVGQAVGRTLTRESLGLVLSFALLPVLVYAATWLPWLHHFGHDVIADPVASFSALRTEHADMWRYHDETLQEFGEDEEGLRTPTHAYYSRPWEWPILARPVLFHSERDGGSVEQVLAIGNPAIAWASVLAIPFLAITWRRRRDWRAGFLLVAFLGQWLPWFAVDRPQFSFYLLPMTPFIAFAVVYLLRALAGAHIVIRDRETGVIATNPETGAPAVSRSRPYLPFVIAFVAAVVGLAVWFWPILTSTPISEARWRSIVWFRAWM